MLGFASGISRGFATAWSLTMASVTPSVKSGDKAPDFTTTDDSDSRVSLVDFKGKWVVLFFYPKDDTPG